MSGLSLGDNQTGRLVPQKMKMVTIPSQIPYQMMMYSSVLRHKMHYWIQWQIFQNQLLNLREIWRRKILLLMLSDGYKAKAKPQMSNQLHDSSLHSRENRDETSTSIHQTGQEKKKKTKKEKKKGKTDGTIESPVIIDDEGQAEEREIPKKRKGFSYYPLLTYKRDLDKTFYYKYFRPYSHDYRRLRMEEDCQCPQNRTP